MRPRAWTACALAVAALGGSAPGAAAEPVITVDFGHSYPARSVVGLLHGMDAAQPPDRLVRPLLPRSWRGDLYSTPYERVLGFGARYIVVVSDLWGYPGANWYGRRPPWEDLDAWAAYVRGLARANRGHRLVWDIWNEPDLPYYWNGTMAQFHATYRVAYETLRAELGPRAVIGGPSVSRFRWSWLVGLLEYCRRADCEVNALSWHELPGDSPGIAAISSHLRRARSWLLRNPAYVVLGLRELHVNEAVGPGDQLYPGEQVAYLAELERGGARAATRACWPEPSGMDNCRARSLDGLLDPLSLRPRAPWWVTAWYARGVGARVSARVTGGAVAALATRRSLLRRRAEVLIGAYDPHDGTPPAPASVRVELAGLHRVRALRGSARVGVAAFHLPDAGAAPASPQETAHQIVPIEADRATVTVTLEPHEAVLLRLFHPR
jgi:hypothetical protein